MPRCGEDVLERSKATGSRSEASPVVVLTIEPCDIPNGTDMTPHIPENFSTWLSVGITGNALPPRDPNDDDDDDEDEEDEEDEDEEPAVVREPDDDE